MSLLEEIRALPAEVLETRDPEKIAEALSEGRTELVPGTLMGEGLVWAQLGFEEGSAVLDRFEKLAEEYPIFARPLRALQAGKLDIGLQVTRDAIAGLASMEVMSADQAETLLAPGLRPARVDELDVRRVCYSDNGDWII